MNKVDQQKSSIQLLIEFADKTRRSIFFEEDQHQVAMMYRGTMTKRIVYIPGNHDEQVFLVGYYDPKSLSENELYFGAFFPLSLPTTQILSIRKKYFIDKLNLFNSQILKLNIKDFDSLTVMTGNDESLVNKYLNDFTVQQSILDSLELTGDMCVGINKINIDFIPAFKDKSNFGIFTKLKWITDDELLETLLAKSGAIYASFLPFY